MRQEPTHIRNSRGIYVRFEIAAPPGGPAQLGGLMTNNGNTFSLAPANIVIAAVGGQGALTAARILGHFALHHDLDVKVSEIHGMSQRGGSVVTHVKFANKVYSPVVEKGTADVVLAFEQLEGARHVDFARPGGILVLNMQKIIPMPVLLGTAEYPPTLQEALTSTGLRIVRLDARSIAVEQGNPRTVNAVMLGALARTCEWPKPEFEASVRASVPERFAEINIEAFKSGYENSNVGVA